MIARFKEKYPWWKRLVIIPVIAIGILGFVLLVKTKKQPARSQPDERVTPVRIIEAKSMQVVPRALGYGYIQPFQVWDAVAEVSGRVVELHPEFKRGSVLPKGELLVLIDPAESGYIREQSEADVQQVLALIHKLDQSEEDTKRQLEVEEGKLVLTQKELERNKKLVAQGVISQSELDTKESNYLAQRNSVQNFQSTLNSIPAERASLRAQLAAARSKTAGARLDESKTAIRTPFDCRLSSTNVELGQAVSVNQVVASLDSLGEYEASVQVPFYAFRNLLPREELVTLGTGVEMEELRRFLGINAMIRLRAPDGVMEWSGTLSRISDTVDTSTRTIGVYVAVDNTYTSERSNKQPPLVKNMYVEVELLGKPSTPYLVLPRGAINGGFVNVMDKDDRLARREVSVAFVQSSLAAVESGIEPGDRIVVSELVPAIDGMLLSGQIDEAMQQRLADEAAGKVALK